jgi:hypothetical protein
MEFKGVDWNQLTEQRQWLELAIKAMDLKSLIKDGEVIEQMSDWQSVRFSRSSSL